MAFINGSGGHFYFLRIDEDFEPVEVVTVATTQWAIQDATMPLDVSNVAQSTGTRYATAGADLSWTAVFPLEEFGEPDALGLNSGVVTTVWFKVGSPEVLDAWHRIDETLITLTAPVNNAAGDAVRFSVTGKGGAVTYYTTAPTVPGGGSG